MCLNDCNLTWHSHIDRLYSQHKMNLLDKAGIISQVNATESIQIIINLIKQNKMTGKVIIITGASGSGKTALGLALGKELGESVPFTIYNGSEFSFLHLNKTSRLIQSCRKAIGIKILDTVEFYEGEITDIEIDKLKIDNLQSIIIGLKTIEGSLRIKLKESLFKKFNEKNIKIGDIIYIEPHHSIIKIIGKSSSFYRESDINNYKYVTIPHGKVFKKKTIIQEITLNDLDLVNIQNKKQLYSKASNVSHYLRQEVDKLVLKFIKLKKAQLLYGVLFIDEAHALYVESFCFLNKLLDSKFSPLILLATNRATPIDFKNSLDSKIPISFLDRCLILRTKIYSINEITNIIGLKAKNCSLLMTGNCFKELKNISLLTSLRYSILLTLSSGLVANILKKKI